MFSEKRFSQGINIQGYMGQYWYTEKPVYYRVQGEVIYTVDRKATIKGLGAAYVIHYRINKKLEQKTTYKLISQSGVDFFRLSYPEVKAPYGGMNSLILYGANYNMPTLRQLFALRMEREICDIPTYLYGGVEFQPDLNYQVVRPNYRLGIGWILNKK